MSSPSPATLHQVHLVQAGHAPNPHRRPALGRSLTAGRPLPRTLGLCHPRRQAPNEWRPWAGDCISGRPPHASDGHHAAPPVVDVALAPIGDTKRCGKTCSTVVEIGRAGRLNPWNHHKSRLNQTPLRIGLCLELSVPCLEVRVQHTRQPGHPRGFHVLKRLNLRLNSTTKVVTDHLTIAGQKFKGMESRDTRKTNHCSICSHL